MRWVEVGEPPNLATLLLLLLTSKHYKLYLRLVSLIKIVV